MKPMRKQKRRHELGLRSQDIRKNYVRRRNTARMDKLIVNLRAAFVSVVVILLVYLVTFMAFALGQ